MKSAGISGLLSFSHFMMFFCTVLSSWFKYKILIGACNCIWIPLCHHWCLIILTLIELIEFTILLHICGPNLIKYDLGVISYELRFINYDLGFNNFKRGFSRSNQPVQQGHPPVLAEVLSVTAQENGNREKSLQRSHS